jgi:methionyl-tRNA synthetase
MPDSAAKILDLVAAAPDARAFTTLDRALVPGTPLPKPEPVFPRYVEKEAGAA